MLNYTIKRIFEVIPVLLIVSTIVFSVMHLLPGDPTLLMLAGAEGGSIPQERLDELRNIMGLNKPLHESLVRFADSLFKTNTKISYKRLKNKFLSLKNFFP